MDAELEAEIGDVAGTADDLPELDDEDDELFVALAFVSTFMLVAAAFFIFLLFEKILQTNETVQQIKLIQEQQIH